MAEIYRPYVQLKSDCKHGRRSLTGDWYRKVHQFDPSNENKTIREPEMSGKVNSQTHLQKTFFVSLSRLLRIWLQTLPQVQI
jgi:hypothetical protein